MNENVRRLADSIEKVIVGKEDTVLKLICALLCEGSGRPASRPPAGCCGPRQVFCNSR